ncbi:hypothetical protein BT96DRAFT_945625 [Gymnopus androsaceus JB14]|uniref:STE3-domain-containing protein n=1 Tax=Gymnopus androsaceus JB14 TaxID=1447944 RepID=A0A6A4H1M5_9AGAR|nr:hypothetical protein BT96DRAFT_945625 [Gymnopus androsaceus JB14]
MAVSYLLLLLFDRSRPQNQAPIEALTSSDICFPLLLANVLQSTGTVMSLKWALRDEVVAGTFCGIQGGIKQAGNVGTAVWSFLLSLHLFNLLFLRFHNDKDSVLDNDPRRLGHGCSRGHHRAYSASYPRAGSVFRDFWALIFLEYFFEFLSAALSMILYITIILRVRGNLVHTDGGKWNLQFVPSGDSWRLAVGRDLIDTAMMKFAQNMVWFPICYAIILIPVTIARLQSFAGKSVSFEATVFTDVVFNMTGLVNVTLHISLSRFYPDMDVVPLPDFHTQRRAMDSLAEAGGVTPFTLTRSDTAETYRRDRETTLRGAASTPERRASNGH